MIFKVRKEETMNIQEELFGLRDEKYRDFHSRLMPTIDKNRIIGVRTPDLRKLAKEISGGEDAERFLLSLPHDYYEENNLHAFLIEGKKDFSVAVGLTEKFLPYIDNWATCDAFSPKVFSKNPDKILPYIYKWIQSDKVYTVRYAIGLLMSIFLDANFKEEYLSLVCGIKSGEYYVNMMIAWYFATALAKQYESAVGYIENRHLSRWVHNKAIQKSVESRRISDDKKAYLRTLKY